MSKLLTSYRPAWPLLAALLAGCSGEPPGEELRSTLEKRGVSPRPVAHIPVNDIDDPISQLGRSLFFSTQLSGNGDVACVSCHHPLLGGGDDLSLPIGIDATEPEKLGSWRQLDQEKSVGHTPGHRGPANVPRNSPTTFDSGYYRTVLFWDGRVRLDSVSDDGSVVTPDSLFATPDPQAIPNDLVFAQSRFPVTSAEEMLGFDHRHANNTAIREGLERRLKSAGEGKDSAWLPAFREAFSQPTGDADDLITFSHISRALTAYQRSQDFVNSPWAAYVEGDDSALSERQKRGALLFYRGSEDGGESCASCHAGAFFTDEQFYNLAVPQIGTGKDKLDNDYGRVRVSRHTDDKYRFRTPHLLNVAETAPYGHSGAYESLLKMVWHHIDPQGSVADFDFSLQHLRQFEGVQGEAIYPYSRENTERALKTAGENGDLPDLRYSREEAELLVAFLESLSDPCVKSASCLTPWLPDGDEPGAWDLLDAQVPDRSQIVGGVSQP